MDIFIESDSSFYEYVTFHRQKRIENERKIEEEVEGQRKQEYEDYYYDNINKPNSIFQLPGINVIDYTHTKIKFSFTPKQVINLISGKVVFYCSIRHINGQWMVKRNSLPLPVRKIVYYQFLEHYVKIVKLSHVVSMIKFIHEKTVHWSEAYQNLRKLKYERYLKDPDSVFLDSEDEELFLTEEEVRQRHEKIEIIWWRMLPPTVRSRPAKKRQTRKYVGLH